MNILQIRNELRSGKTIFDLPLRVTYYARVSTDKDEQRNSLENQIQYYTDLIRSKPNWTYVEGYMDEGISGTSTKKRDSFNRMIADAKADCFDFIITKEISRFSRSTLDSIRYTQELLEHDVGVLFENDGINTLDSDSEFRLVIMAGVAQDEVRKLSDRLKFGFRQAIKNGHVLGNDRLWGYDKKNCVLTVNEEEARIVRRIFELYANEQLGMRRISLRLLQEGITGREGGAFNLVTIRHILCNPKYKGWYCAHKTQTVDYRSKRKLVLDENEWIMYPDPAVPAIVSEELWDRAHALYKSRSRQAKAHAPAAGYQNRYPYSGKLLCEEHDTVFYRQLLKSKAGSREEWQCRHYRDRGAVGCKSPHPRTEELNRVMAKIFDSIVIDTGRIVEIVADLVASAEKREGGVSESRRLQEELQAISVKKDKLLTLYIDGALSSAEFKQRNDALNMRSALLQNQVEASLRVSAQGDALQQHLAAVREALTECLSFRPEPVSAIVTSILKHIVVKCGSTAQELRLMIYLKFSDPLTVILARRRNSSFCDTSSKNTTHSLPSRRI